MTPRHKWCCLNERHLIVLDGLWVRSGKCRLGCGYNPRWIQSSMITVNHVTKRFGTTVVLNDVCLAIERHDCVGLVGPNGAGKTTLLRILAGYLAPTRGTVLVEGVDLFWHSVQVRRRIGYLPENAPLYPEMRIDEYLDFRAALKRVPRRRRRLRRAEVKEQCGLKDQGHAVIGRLSRGFRQRVALADGLIHEPDILLLDEPFLGLDDNQADACKNLLNSLCQRQTVVMASHRIAELEGLCQRLIPLQAGRKVDTAPTDTLALDATGQRHEAGRAVTS